MNFATLGPFTAAVYPAGHRAVLTGDLSSSGNVFVKQSKSVFAEFLYEA